jgi:hypothetical protein
VGPRELVIALGYRLAQPKAGSELVHYAMSRVARPNDREYTRISNSRYVEPAPASAEPTRSRGGAGLAIPPNPVGDAVSGRLRPPPRDHIPRAVTLAFAAGAIAGRIRPKRSATNIAALASCLPATTRKSGGELAALRQSRARNGLLEPVSWSPPQNTNGTCARSAPGRG